MTTCRRVILAAGLAVASLGWPAAAEAPEQREDGWEVAAPEDMGLDAARLDALGAELDAGALSGVRAVLLAHNGVLVFERYADGASGDDLVDARHIGASLIGSLIGIALDRGELEGVRRRALQHLPVYSAHDNPDLRKDEIAIEDLLTMSSPLECDDSNPFSRGNAQRMYLIEDYVRFLYNLPIAGSAPGAPRREDAPRGRLYTFCEANISALAAVVEAVSGEELEDYAATYMFEPLGIEEVEWTAAPNGLATPAAGMRWRARDLAKYGQLYAAGGAWGRRQVLSAIWVEDPIQPRVDVGPNTEFGYMWRLETVEAAGEETEVYASVGGGPGALFVAPSRGLVALIAVEPVRPGALSADPAA
ncbi:MAG: serine hydrolase, partial [Caulobacterales bacterium]|nr:serine hydrolase [Caulobacterales bacterium]